MTSDRVVKAGLGYTVGNILIRGIAFISLPVFSRLLTAEEFGIFNTYMAYESVLSIIIGLGMYSTIRNAKIDFSERLSLYISSLLWITVIPLFISLLCIFLFSDQLFNLIGFSKPIQYLLVGQSFGSAMLSICNTKLSLSYEYKKYIIIALFNTMTNIGLSMLLALYCFNSNKELARIIGSSIPSIIIGIVVFFAYQAKGKFRFNSENAKYAITIGIPLIAHYLSQQIQNQFDRIAITELVGPDKTGIYSFSYSIANILQVIFYSLENIWVVWFYGEMAKKQYKNIRQASKNYILIVTWIAVFMLFGSKEIIMILGDKEYWEGVGVFIPILIGEFFLFLYTIPAGVEYYLKKTNYIAIMTAFAAIFNIFTNYIFIPKFGYIAAAFTTMFTYFIQFLAHWIIYIYLIKKHNINEVFCFTDIIKAFILVLASGIIVFVLNPYPFVKYLTLLCMLICAMIKYKNEINKLIEVFKLKLARV